MVIKSEEKEKIYWPYLYRAGERVNVDNPVDGLRTVIQAIREQWYAALPDETRAEIGAKAKLIGAYIPSGFVERVKSCCPEIDLKNWANRWNEPHFHETTRLHISPAPKITKDKAESDPTVREKFLTGIKKIPQVQFLRKLYVEQGKNVSEKTLDDILWNQDISILPLNLVLPTAVNYFLPTEWEPHTEDSFGVKQRGHVVTVNEKDVQYYLATRKDDYTTFLVIFGRGPSVMCLTACKDCYRGTETRELKPFRIIEPDKSRSEARFFDPDVQVSRLAHIANTDPRYSGVNDMLLSGGEPLQESNEMLRKILAEVEKAQYLKSFRICTGDLYLGRAARFDDELVEMLSDFSKRTGKSVHIAAHIPHEEMLTPEAIYASLKLRKAGIEIQTQTPLIGGINVFLPDIEMGEDALTITELERVYKLAIEKSYATLLRLMNGIVAVTGNRPYKWLNDTEGSVPIEYGALIWEFWRQHRGQSDTTRATSYAKFHNDTNLDLSLPVIGMSERRVDNGEVVTHIPQGGETYELRQLAVYGVNSPVEEMQKFYRHLLGSSTLFKEIIRGMMSKK